MNDALENIAEIIPDLKAKIEMIGNEVPRFNNDILNFYTEFDFGNKEYLRFTEFTAYISFICKELQIPMDEKTLGTEKKAELKSTATLVKASWIVLYKKCFLKKCDQQ